MEGILRVTPEQLNSAATEFDSTGQRISTLTAQMLSIVDNMRSAWQGEAATGFINRFDALKEDINKISVMIREHVNDLNSMASEYKQAEEASLEQANALATEVVS